MTINWSSRLNFFRRRRDLQGFRAVSRGDSPPASSYAGVDPELLCPISGRLFRFPVRTPCNHVFSRNAILAWLTKKSLCALCRRALAAHELMEASDIAERVRQCVYDQADLQKEVEEEDSAALLSCYNPNYYNRLSPR
mmetsp:Transcript_13033/g.21376  ORF Transcript_13033/g.21376 Transcript_13033/m.21376 type:complete len:138 (+) Transcript_13033:3-416(+)